MFKGLFTNMSVSKNTLFFVSAGTFLLGYNIPFQNIEKRFNSFREGEFPKTKWIDHSIDLDLEPRDGYITATASVNQFYSNPERYGGADQLRGGIQQKCNETGKPMCHECFSTDVATPATIHQ